MLEEIRLYMMERAFNLKQEAENWVGEVCPSAVTKMEEFGEDIKLWELSRIPCVHAQVAILYTNQDPANFISSWFNKNNYKATYDQNIHPVNGSILWEETSYTKPLPPIERRMPGRPRVKRRRHVSENQDKCSQVSSKGRTIQCGGRAGGRVGGGRSRGSGRGSSGRGNRGGVRGFSEGVQTEYGEGTSEFPKCEPELVAIPNVESENDASQDFHNHISLTIDNLRKSLYTTEEIMDCLGLSEAELQQIEGLGLSEAEVQQNEDVDVAMSQDVGIASQITVEELPTNQLLGDEERMNEEDSIDKPGMGEVMTNEERMDSEREIPITQQLNQVIRRTTKRSKVNQVRRRKPSERIIEIKLEKVVVVKNGKEMSSSNPLSLD
ncbi:unnamed protein product [Lactuca saligna]|uniref:Uncharacterized protein n=1 Tax=Lactuca saligna TaxID=75948 RepID=A0AA35YWW4_LACSI|nr:unnamed protein product [Lactuca saligna]